MPASALRLASASIQSSGNVIQALKAGSLPLRGAALSAYGGYSSRGELLQDGEDVLEEVELFVARARPDCPRESADRQNGH
jgi:hypothetical protein